MQTGVSRRGFLKTGIALGASAALPAYAQEDKLERSLKEELVVVLGSKGITGIRPRDIELTQLRPEAYSSDAVRKASERFDYRIAAVQGKQFATLFDRETREKAPTSGRRHIFVEQVNPQEARFLNDIYKGDTAKAVGRFVDGSKSIDEKLERLMGVGKKVIRHQNHVSGYSVPEFKTTLDIIGAHIVNVNGGMYDLTEKLATAADKNVKGDFAIMPHWAEADGNHAWALVTYKENGKEQVRSFLLGDLNMRDGKPDIRVFNKESHEHPGKPYKGMVCVPKVYRKDGDALVDITDLFTHTVDITTKTGKDSRLHVWNGSWLEDKGGWKPVAAPSKYKDGKATYTKVGAVPRGDNTGIIYRVIAEGNIGAPFILTPEGKMQTVKSYDGKTVKKMFKREIAPLPAREVQGFEPGKRYSIYAYTNDPRREMKELGNPVEYQADKQGVLRLPGIEAGHLLIGMHKKERYPYTIVEQAGKLRAQRHHN